MIFIQRRFTCDVLITVAQLSISAPVSRINSLLYRATLMTEKYRGRSVRIVAIQALEVSNKQHMLRTIRLV